MKVCFIGLGSIAGRHIKNLKSILGSEVIIDVLRSGIGRETDCEINSLINQIFYSAEGLDDKYDAVFVTNPTSLHYKTLLEFNDISNYFFIEKPVFENADKDIAPLMNNKKVYYTACPLRYTNVIRYLKESIDFSAVYSMRCISSSYLPDWRPDTDYRKSYSADKVMGGGVSIDLIHEWDYIHYLIGSPVKVKSFIRKKSNLEINSDDIAVYIAEYSDKIVELHLDYFGRKPIRRIELFCDNDTIIADLIRQNITWMKQGKRVDLFQERDEYQRRELQHFINIINGKCVNDNDLLKSMQILRLAEGK